MEYTKTEYVPHPRRYVNVSTDGRVVLRPRRINGDIEWHIEIDGIDLNVSRRSLRFAQCFVKAELERNDGKALPKPKVLWVETSVDRKAHEVVASSREEAIELAGVNPEQVTKVIVSPRQRQ